MDASLPARGLALAMLVAATCVLATACGGDDGAGPKSDAKPRTAPATPKEVTVPATDAALTKEVGADATPLLEAGCVLGTYEVGEAKHVSDGDEIDFTTFPPNGGTHYEDWAPFGVYDEPVPDGYLVHNMEHGGVVTWFGTEVPKPLRSAAQDLADDGEKWVFAPRDDLAGLVSAAWGKGLTCPPTALATLEPETFATGLDAWYDAVASTGSEAEKDVPPYAGAMQEPTPTRDISEDPPF